ncbi:MAG: radical SAM protein [Oscillospiraceae bacterium]|nr:radical SAM protein [Oscillospiraceae bacterium]
MALSLKNSIAGRVASKIKGVLPLDAGDAALNGLIGRIIAHPDRAETLFGEGEIFLIKAALYLTGVRLEESAYEGVGSVYKELLGVYQFDLNLRRNSEKLLPAELALPHGLHVPIVVNDASPFSLARDKGVLYLSVSGMRIFPVEYEKRPAFYNKKTSDGVEMWKIAQHRLGDELMVTYNTYCHTLKGGNQCRFCALNANEAIYRTKNSFFIQTPYQIAEVAKAAYAEGVIKRLEITGGILPGRAEVDFIIAVGEAIKKRLGTDTIPGGHVLVAAPNDLEQIDALKAAGWEYVFFNLEVWNPHLFAGLCPGKEEIIGREHWLKALDYAVEVFGQGNVRSILIAGLEPLNSYLEGAEYLTQHGIFADPSPWMPMPGSMMEGQSTPTAQWHINLLVQTLDLWERYGWSLEEVAKDGWLSFNDLAALRLHVWRDYAGHPEKNIKEDLRYKLAVLGQLDAI